MNKQQSERRETWRKRITEQQKSGLSVGAYCKQNDVAEHNFYYWRKAMRGDKGVTFALVKTKQGNPPDPMIELVLATGERLRVPSDEATLRLVLRVLRERQ